MSSSNNESGLKPSIDIETYDEDAQLAAARQVKRTGFLPIVTNRFDRVFISVVIWIALSLFWMRLLEPVGLSIWISNVIAVALAAVIITRG
jgi:predicted small integral membrane protein